MSMDSDIREIKSALSENKRSLTEIQKEFASMKNILGQIQRSGFNDFFRTVNGNALASAITKISSINSSLEKIEKSLR